jgi:hypothetical protein
MNPITALSRFALHPLRSCRSTSPAGAFSHRTKPSFFLFSALLGASFFSVYAPAQAQSEGEAPEATLNGMTLAASTPASPASGSAAGNAGDDTSSPTVAQGVLNVDLSLVKRVQKCRGGSDACRQPRYSGPHRRR